MNILFEEILIYGGIALFCVVIIVIYLRNQKKKSDATRKKIAQAKLDGTYEPVSLHPEIDSNSCIQTGACIAACPEKDILGIVDGKATCVNTSVCVGHGACFHACPTQAITLCIGTEKRGVDLPHVSQTFESNVEGIYIAGELGGMGLIKNAVEQGRQAVDNISKKMPKQHQSDYDLVIVGAGPAGISAALNAKKHKLKAVILEQDSLGGTVFSFPRSKIVMTNPMELPLFGKLKLYETSKTELVQLWKQLINDYQVEVREHIKVEEISQKNGGFHVKAKTGEELSAHNVLLAIGRRGTPRKLGVPGEENEKVAYRLIEPELINDKNVIVVGGGDSAVEAALSLADQNNVILSYRSEAFKRIKQKNREKINASAEAGKVDIRFNTNVIKIDKESVEIKDKDGKVESIPNDLIYIFAGGELPTEFLKKTGILITKKYGEAILKHEK